MVVTFGRSLIDSVTLDGIFTGGIMSKLTFYSLGLLLMALVALPQSSMSQRPKGGAAMSENSERLRVDNLRKSIFAEPFNEEKLQAYLAVLPKDDDLYVLEGDLLMTEQQVRAYVVGKSQAQAPAISSGELLVNIHNGTQDFYKDMTKRNLTYAVDKSSFANPSEYAKVVNNMRLAGQRWQNLCATCGVRFTYLSQHDASPTHDKVNFIVRFHNVNGAYIAAAFFPNYAPTRRYVNIDPSYFTTSFDKVGVLRHELGHTLGYRHEHIQDIPGCFREDNNWMPLTPYDPKSVMHYFCGGAGSLTLDITQLDRAGHRRLYKRP